ncbi:GGDEF domain-containing protein [Photobacterium kishitanii]|uniref:GGDEF domain-containing protein n=1 Tax=Photobacterium kishitanii TaxID=318456 RepID=A0A0B7JBT3_9GAMM|nr:EAL domain-containing protein [Photobacterium kishitanii]OBU27607.1 diguanylate phosphodiesterase [Photobacterium kishitanii]PSU88234.1 GGDEF domain-containing protein [Photobacterium kishitanii]PSU92559.1 GGDEF domain-containing protein [Photobacterium kishitanii]PSV14511.1 GGDEF domain-containing protein [Photobacterium kishitanii]PSW68521.1 GGDEF domain-containing protein [Photobacterium kishitanii]
MTLYRQLLLWMLVVLFSLTGAVFAIQFNTTKSYLIEQQSTELNNVVSSVGFALSPYLEAKDLISAESVINATFDSGYYSQVKLALLDSKKEIIRQYPQLVQSVPNWFQSLVHIEAITQTRTLTSGWLQLADLTVTSSPASAYIQLWKATIQLVFGFITCLLLGAIVLSLVLNKVLKPLKQIQKSAQEMALNHFTPSLPTPHTRELADLVTAFNSMNIQLQQHFEQQAQEADTLRIRAYQDPVSGLANRSYLMTKLSSWLSSKPSGGIILLKSDAIEDSYQQSGYESGDQLVLKLAERLKDLSADDITIARLNQSEFMLIAPNVSEDDLLDTGRIMLDMTSELNSDPLGIAPLQAAVGIVMCSDTLTITALLAHADNALNKARQQVKEPIALLETNDNKTIPAMGKQHWKALVDEAIANNLIHFTFQNAINTDNDIIHKEMFAYIEKGQQRFNAGQFLSAIEKLNEGTKFDCYIIETIFNQLTKQKKSVPVAINITQSSINDTGFIRWLNSKLQSCPQMKQHILFELPEICFIKNIDNTSLLCEIIRQNGFQFGIDNYGHNFSSTGYLNKLRPSYVKLDFAYTSQLDDQVKMDVLESITRSANNLSVLTIASRVETIEQKEKLTLLKVQGFQGYVTAQLVNGK